MSVTTTQLLFLCSVNSGCCNGCIFTASAKILTINENEREKNKNNSKTAAKPQIKTNKNKHLKKTP